MINEAFVAVAILCHAQQNPKNCTAIILECIANGHSALSELSYPERHSARLMIYSNCLKPKKIKKPKKTKRRKK